MGAARGQAGGDRGRLQTGLISPFSPGRGKLMVDGRLEWAWGSGELLRPGFVSFRSPGRISESPSLRSGAAVRREGPYNDPAAPSAEKFAGGSLAGAPAGASGLPAIPRGTGRDQRVPRL